MTAPGAGPVLAWQQAVDAAWAQLHGGAAGLAPASGYGPSGPPPKGPQPPGNVNQWIQEAFAILEANGTPATELDANAVAAIIAHESTNNPRAINTWDSNWRKGTPSKGLMQTIDPTFNRYALPGHHNIYDPVDNIIAGTRYAIARYGSLRKVPGIRGLRDGTGYRGY